MARTTAEGPRQHCRLHCCPSGSFLATEGHVSTLFRTPTVPHTAGTSRRPFQPGAVSVTRSRADHLPKHGLHGRAGTRLPASPPPVPGTAGREAKSLSDIFSRCLCTGDQEAGHKACSRSPVWRVVFGLFWKGQAHGRAGVQRPDRSLAQVLLGAVRPSIRPSVHPSAAGGGRCLHSTVYFWAKLVVTQTQQDMKRDKFQQRSPGWPRGRQLQPCPVWAGLLLCLSARAGDRGGVSVTVTLSPGICT